MNKYPPPSEFSSFNSIPFGCSLFISTEPIDNRLGHSQHSALTLFYLNKHKFGTEKDLMQKRHGIRDLSPCVRSKRYSGTAWKRDVDGGSPFIYLNVSVEL